MRTYTRAYTLDGCGMHGLVPYRKQAGGPYQGIGLFRPPILLLTSLSLYSTCCFLWSRIARWRATMRARSNTLLRNDRECSRCALLKCVVGHSVPFVE